MKKIFAAICGILLVMLAFTGCLSAAPNGGMGDPFYMEEDSYGTESFEEITENPFVLTSVNAESTFSLDANTAAYTVMRNRIENGDRVTKDSVRIEEYINYFDYDSYPVPAEGEGLRLNYSLFDCPWNADNKLLRVGLKTEEIKYTETANNLVFLVDVSGSMYGADRLGLVQQSFHLLLEGLGENDRVSIVTYASGTKTVLAGANGSEKRKISRAIDSLKAGGSTAGAGGIQRAYEVAEKYLIEGGNNRVILATDGDFNVGISSTSELEKFISQKRESGVYLSVLGFGMGNTKDDIMETLARNGNGNYAYIDSIEEAKRVLVAGISGMLKTVARDAKALVKFDPETVAQYRLIGYENKLISVEEWEDDRTDTGDIGSGLTVTALYEIVPAEDFGGAESAGDFFVKYKDAEKVHSTENMEKKIALLWSGETAIPSEDDIFISCVAEYGLLLRESRYRGEAGFAALEARLAEISSAYFAKDEFKAEFVELVERAALIYSEL